MIFQICGLTVLILFYGIYLGKMMMQRQKGIQTDQIARGDKHGKLFWTELLMKMATYLVVAAELASVIGNRSLLSAFFQWIGVVLSFAGVLFFAAAVYTMRDSWRAGIPDDKTEFVTRGIYGFSRNPAFVGFDLTYLGLLLMFCNPVLFVCTCFSVTMLHFQILQEEAFLEKTFDREYDAYKNRVRRYLGRRRG